MFWAGGRLAVERAEQHGELTWSLGKLRFRRLFPSRAAVFFEYGAPGPAIAGTRNLCSQLTDVSTENAGPIAVERALYSMELEGHHDVAPPTFELPRADEGGSSM